MYPTYIDLQASRFFKNPYLIFEISSESLAQSY